MKATDTAHRLKEALEMRGMRQVDLLEGCQKLGNANGVKFSKSYISQYLSGKAEPKQDRLWIMSQVLGVSPKWLMGYDDTEEETKINGVSVEILKQLSREELEKVLEFARFLKSEK